MLISFAWGFQAKKGVLVAAFELKVDTMMTLRVNVSDIERMFASISNQTTPDVISAVIFR